MKTEEQLELDDLKNKDELIDEIQAICKANKDNDNCSLYWLADMIKEVIEEVTDE